MTTVNTTTTSKGSKGSKGTPQATPQEALQGTQASEDVGTTGATLSDPATAPADAPAEVVRKVRALKIYRVFGKDGVMYVKATGKGKALQYVAASLLKCAPCTDEELLEAGRTQAEIHDASGLVEQE